MIYKVSFDKQLRPILYPIIAFVLISIYFTNIIIDAWYTEFRVFSIIVYLFLFVYIFVIPIYIHVNYLFFNKGLLFELDNVKKYIICKKEDQILINENYANISKIEIHQTNGYRQRSVNWFSWSAYYYYKLIFKNGKTFYLSRLIIKDLEKFINDKQIDYVNHFIPLIPNK